MFLPHIGGELALELLRFWPGGEPAALQGIDDLINFFGADAGFVEGDSHLGKQKVESRKLKSGSGNLLVQRAVNHGGEDRDKLGRLSFKRLRQRRINAALLPEEF